MFNSCGSHRLVQVILQKQQRNIKMWSKCCQNVAKIGVWRKEKTTKSLFYNNLEVLFSGANRTDIMILKYLNINNLYHIIFSLCDTFNI